MVVGFAAACGRSTSDPTEEIVVFAAASLTDGVEALAETFERLHPGTRVTISVGPTSLLARQVVMGAPADLLLTAHNEWRAYVEENGPVFRVARAPFTNQLAMVTASPAFEVASLTTWPKGARLALADPEQVPAGLYARSLLICMKQWEALQPAVIPALDVRAAMLTVEQGATEAGIVYSSDTYGRPHLRPLGLLADACQPPIAYHVILLGEQHPPSAAAEAFFDFLVAPQRAADWEAFGFTALSDPTP